MGTGVLASVTWTIARQVRAGEYLSVHETSIVGSLSCY